MSDRAELEKVISEMRGSSSFDKFVKTLAARREFVVSQLVATPDQSTVEALRGEARALTYILKAANPRAP